MLEVRHVDLCGMPLACVTRHELADRVFEECERGRGGWIITANIDYFQRFVSEPATARLFRQADLIVADGVPLLWAARLRGSPLPDRVAGSDLVWILAEQAAQRGRSLYLLGGNPGAAEAAASRLRARSPELVITGHCAPMVGNPPTAAQVEALRAELSAHPADIVYVALGAPKEELLIAELRSSFPGTWWIGVGISFSFIAGEVTRAPGFLQRAGLEWLHRLVQEPRRLARRYLLENLPFTLRLLASSAIAGLRR